MAESKSKPQIRSEADPATKPTPSPGEEPVAEPLPTNLPPSPSDEEMMAIAEKNNEETRKLVEDRAEDRIVQQGVPLPQTGLYYRIPGSVRAVNVSRTEDVDLSGRKDLPAQVSQVQTREGGLPALVTFRYDDGLEVMVEWDGDVYDNFMQEQRRYDEEQQERKREEEADRDRDDR